MQNTNACLLSCDQTTGCVAMNYDSSSGDCELLSSVNGTTTAPGAAAATRPVAVSTTYTTFPSTTSAVSSSSMDMGYGGGNGYGYGGGYGASSSMPAQTGAPGNGGQPTTGVNSVGSPVMMSGASQTQVGSSMSMPGQSGVGMGSMTSQGLGGASTTTKGLPSSTTTTSTAQYTGPVCPNYDGSNFADAQNNTYAVACNQQYQGTTIPGNFKAIRQNTAPTAQHCMAECDQINACVAITVTQTQCILYSAVSGTVSTYGSAALYRAQRPGAYVSVVTISTCASTAQYTMTSYTTVNVTTTMTCATPGTCTTSMPGMHGM